MFGIEIINENVGPKGHPVWMWMIKPSLLRLKKPGINTIYPVGYQPYTVKDWSVR